MLWFKGIYDSDLIVVFTLGGVFCQVVVQLSSIIHVYNHNRIMKLVLILWFILS